MCKYHLVLFLPVLVCAFSAAGQSVIESESSIIVNEKTADVSLVIDGTRSGGSKPVELALLDPQGNIRANASQQIRIDSAKKKYKFTLPIGDLIKTAGDDIAWYRLRYRVGNAAGIASLSELMRDDFDLRAAAFERVVPGQPMRIRVRSLNPFTERAVKNVAIKADLTIDLDTESDNDKLKLNATVRTNGDGFASIDFDIPANIKPDGDGELKITGQKNGIVRKIEENLDDNDADGSVVLTTDKPLYQPGQTFSVRALYFDANNTVVANSELQFTIEDEDDTAVYRQTVKTSDYGIAAITWQIPENAKLGAYRVTVEADDDLREDQISFKVSRYDLPNFAVTAKPDKTYYLPNDTEARITVTADYLFGKPVTKGKVRVVQEGDRHWNYREQKYEAEEGDSVEGEADVSGRYIAKFDLKKEISDLQESQWQRYEDVSFSAYYTDLTTNRTEQRRFDIRLTKEPIHIYLIRYGQQHPNLPIIAYVSTFYADGTPVACNVEVKDRNETISRFKTNQIGAGRFEIQVPNDRIKDSEYGIRVVARDKNGSQGTYDESFYLDADDAIQIRTDQTIYKPGDTVDVDLLSTQMDGYVYVDIVKNWEPVDSQVTELHNGKAHLRISYKPSFKGELIIAAYTDKEAGRWSDSMRAVRGIIFPEQQNLILHAKFTKDEYRPGEDAAVKFSVSDGSHKPIQSAIGLGIFDKAIEERARTETEFGGYFSRFYSLLGYDRSFGSITLSDLNNLDMTKPVSPEMQLAAEVMLASGWYYPTVYHSGNLDTKAKDLYSESAAKQLKSIDAALKAQFEKNGEHPVDAGSLRQILAASGIDLAAYSDPWGLPYIPAFSVDRTMDIVKLRTAGADKKPGTADDFDVLSRGFEYFTRTGNAIDSATLKYRNGTGSYIRDLPTLLAELGKEGIGSAQLKDRWGRDYRISFEVSGRNYVIRFRSLGPNGVYEPETWRSDDFEVWSNFIDYFSGTEQEVNRILDEEVNLKKKPFPRNEADFRELLRRGGLDVSSIKDGYGRSVYINAFVQPRYADKTTINNGKTTIKPVTEEVMVFKIRSRGADTMNAEDDADLATFSSVITEAYKGTGFAKANVNSVAFTGAKGAIRGTVTDPNGAVIPGAKVTAIDENDSSKQFSTTTSDNGEFLLTNLPSGMYHVAVTAANFTSMVGSGIQVRSQTLIEINFTLSIGAVTETVEVTAQALQSVETSASMTMTKTQNKNARISFPYKEQTSTPRLREYFPETLVWQPELVTDKKGKAEMNFKMADNITTWKMFAIASTKKGKVGVIEKEIPSFQSFFVDLEPPKFLTEGDEIYLSTQVRNYTERQQKVDMSMDKSDWFNFLGADKQQVDVAANQSENAIFGFKAVAPVTAGKQRVTAMAQTDSDAIEKPVTVRPNGEELVRTDSKVFNGSARFDIDYPANAIPGTQKAGLKIYPNLFSHVAESVEGLLERPYGCGEQTVSSTYPNLMILKFVKADTPLRQKAQRYLEKGYERLLGYQSADGGFTYWGGKDAPDVALTAYALRFLNDAKPFIGVDENIIKRAEDWLIKQQRPDGSWTKKYNWETGEDSNRTKLITTYVARSLAMSARDRTELAKALAYLKTRNAEIDEPHALALFGLASLDAGDAVTAKRIAAQLEKMAIPEGRGVYWNLETNTPFYGWGTAGRIETTALVVQLLTRIAAPDGAKSYGDAASKGLVFLLKNKDRYGVWCSTQTTINVLDSFLAILTNSAAPQSQTLHVSINGTDLPDIAVSADRIEPVTVDLTGKLSSESNSVEVRGAADSPLMAQIVADHYIDWRDSKSTNTNIGDTRAVRLDYKCDKTNPAIMEEVTCSVDAERVGFKGYGMLLAEIGTPPGADVSRESLEAAMQNDWSLSSYDILPDRVVFYMWAKAGGTKFNFKFRLRYGINAQTPASVLYDYYNPEAHATVAPLRFSSR